ncbi:HAMP domain-containing sensor histidine kinase [Mesorhizobium sp. LHD-90]|uniref:HAMP domain-containing sensor histidine kinase n=1 Tax=Mesorhizobium sp. LHD-90 TaxID=3071414 RepID=UPI0027DF78F9|nr:HAMP domain-containing sensor histidine kinase [Mesorhizobium sp. LHD-90]MDQ6436316.1 HAMP domain-containing sensor histidine kinase [Mesorhizobium sp. LHD-90]
MKPTAAQIKAALPFLCLGFALLLSGWAFFRSEHYRAESDLNFSQNFEVQWRTTQIREHLARIHGDLRLAAATGQMQSDLARQVFLLNANVGQLLKLEYAPKFLRDRDIQLLNELQGITRTDLDPLMKGSTDFEGALKSMPDLERRMFEVSGTAVAHAETLNAAARIGAAASRNRFLFAVALTLAAVGYTIIHFRNAFARRRDSQLRSFSTLYAHMTRSRITALRLFLDYQDKTSVQHPEMLVAAKDAVKELENITHALGTIAYASSDVIREPFSKILESVTTLRRQKPDLILHRDAAMVEVPAAQVQFVIAELLRNAEAAVQDRADPSVRIAASIKSPTFSGKRKLLVQVTDNGSGMPPSVLAKASTPFYSTKAGQHTGLGLTACAQMVAALKGKFTISSRPGNGTSVQIVLPV